MIPPHNGKSLHLLIQLRLGLVSQQNKEHSNQWSLVIRLSFSVARGFEVFNHSLIFFILLTHSILPFFNFQLHIHSNPSSTFSYTYKLTLLQLAPAFSVPLSSLMPTPISGIMNDVMEPHRPSQNAASDANTGSTHQSPVLPLADYICSVRQFFATIR